MGFMSRHVCNMVHEGLMAMIVRGQVKMTALVALALAGFGATTAQAQWYPQPPAYVGPRGYYEARPFTQPHVYYGRAPAYQSQGLHPVEIAAILHNRYGFSEVSRPQREGAVYVATAVDGNGQPLRIIVDAYSGTLLDGQLLRQHARRQNATRTEPPRARVAVARPEPAQAKPKRIEVPRGPVTAVAKPEVPRAVPRLQPAAPSSTGVSTQPKDTGPSAATASYPPALAPALAPTLAPAATPTLAAPRPVAPAAAPTTVKAESSPPAAATNSQGQPVRMIPIAPLEETRRAPTGPAIPAVPPAPLN
jgi:hypothetical protein